MDYLKSRRIIKKILLIEVVDKDAADMRFLNKQLSKAIKIPTRFLSFYGDGEQELQEHNNRRK